MTPDSAPEFPDDAERWQEWWAHNEERWLDLRTRVRSAQASPEGRTTTHERAADAVFLSQHVIPALIASLADDQPEAVRREALLALAEIGAPELRRADAADDFNRLALQAARSPRQALAESALVAIGLAGGDEHVRKLVHVLHGCGDGTAWLETGRISDRQRAFAAYGLGLASVQSENHDLRRYVVHHLDMTLAREPGAPDDVRTACVQAMGLAALPWCDRGTDEVDGRIPAECRESQLVFLTELVEDRREDRIVRAHAATSVARLLVGAPEAWREEIGTRLCKQFEDRRDTPRELRQSLALALGMTGDSDGDALDKRVRRDLEKAIASTDQPTRHFATLALAETAARPGIGAGEPLGAAASVRRDMLSQLARGKSTQRPWAGLALGLLGSGLNECGALPSEDASRALASRLGDARSPEEVGAYALALGLRQDGQERGAIEEKLADFAGRDEARGHLALSLGLLGARNAQEPLRTVELDSSRRPWVLRQTSVALAMLDDGELPARLSRELSATKSLPEGVGLAHSLGRVGGRAAAETLLARLQDPQLPDVARGACAGALGEIHARGRFPWQTHYAAGANYLAGTRLFGAGSTDGLLAMP
ncbi:MAG: hypothetical protein KDC14_03385 [Planctomycetes bacterium]|nr:hypothetical protein [Planctomycetota bacterium]